MLSRRWMLKGLAATTLLPSARARAQERRVTTTHIAIEDGRVWIAATIGGAGPLLFVIDTGGEVSLMQPQIAERLGLRQVSLMRMAGVGGLQNFRFVEARDIVFSSGLRQPSAVFGVGPTALDLGQGAAGAFAAGLFTASDSDLDFGRGEWRLYADGRGDWSGYTQLPSQIQHVNDQAGSAFVFVDAGLDGTSLRLLVDTGMPGQLSLFPVATRRSGLWNDAGPYAPNQRHGIGGAETRGRLVRARRLTMGDIGFDRPLVSLSDPTSVHVGTIADGIIGLELLERLNLSTDVRGRRLWAQLNSRTPRPERYGLSGLWLEERRGAVIAVEVSPHSPAAEAGIRIGDEIEGVQLRSFIRLLAGRPGQAIPLTLRRGGERVQTTLTLRAFL